MGSGSRRLGMAVCRLAVRRLAVRLLAVGALAGCGLVLAGCGAQTPRRASDPALRALVREARPIGAGARFHPPAPVRVRSRCRRTLGRRFPVHLELFAANRVVIVPAGIGVGRPWRELAGRISAARCFGDLVTLDPTGVVLVQRGGPRTLAALFGAWGEPLSSGALAGFTAAPSAGVRVYVDGQRRAGPVRAVRLTPDAEIVLELGPYVPPHARYVFPPRARGFGRAGRRPSG